MRSRVASDVSCEKSDMKSSPLLLDTEALVPRDTEEKGWGTKALETNTTEAAIRERRKYRIMFAWKRTYDEEMRLMVWRCDACRG